MPPSGADNIRAFLTVTLNKARGRRAVDRGTHIELESNGRTYKITVEHVGPEDGRDRLAPRDIGPFKGEGHEAQGTQERALDQSEGARC